MGEAPGDGPGFLRDIVSMGMGGCGIFVVGTVSWAGYKHKGRLVPP